MTEEKDERPDVTVQDLPCVSQTGMAEQVPLANPEVRMGNHRRLHKEAGLSGHRTVKAMGSVLLFACFLGAGSCGTSGSSLPQPAPTFTTIDAPGAGTAMGLGTFVQDINTEGDIV